MLTFLRIWRSFSYTPATPCTFLSCCRSTSDHWFSLSSPSLTRSPPSASQVTRNQGRWIRRNPNRNGIIENTRSSLFSENSWQPSLLRPQPQDLGSIGNNQATSIGKKGGPQIRIKEHRIFFLFSKTLLLLRSLNLLWPKPQVLGSIKKQTGIAIRKMKH